MKYRYFSPAFYRQLFMGSRYAMISVTTEIHVNQFQMHADGSDHVSGQK